MINDNLKALLDQAIDSTKFPGRDPIQLDNGHFSFTEKLAELIVRECVKVLQDQTNIQNSAEVNNMANALKEHFGFAKPPMPKKQNGQPN